MSRAWQNRIGAWALALTIALLCGWKPAVAAGAPPHRALKTVLGCILSERPAVQVLDHLGLKQGGTASVRYYQGHVPGIPQSNGYYVLLYSADKSLAWLLIAGGPAGHGRVWPYDGAFNFTRERGRLDVQEGFGGLATYRTFGDFARYMEAHEPVIKVRLDPCARCCGPLPAG